MQAQPLFTTVPESKLATRGATKTQKVRQFGGPSDLIKDVRIGLMNSLSSSIGHQLSNARRKSGFTQAEVAKRADTTVNHYAKIERGEVTPSLKTLEKIVKALGIKSADVLPF